jgi:hypothetical protein
MKNGIDDDTVRYAVLLNVEIWLENSRDPNEYLDRLTKEIAKDNNVYCTWR